MVQWPTTSLIGPSAVVSSSVETSKVLVAPAPACNSPATLNNTGDSATRMLFIQRQNWMLAFGMIRVNATAGSNAKWTYVS